ncbi:MAG: glutamate--cysteine ligase [Buchananella hordeovulneris]|nr:glutamate--cysteine ligase [Buchananella hordeovulneris]
MALDFAPSKRSTLGIEWELQLVDRDSRDLRQCAEAVIQAVTPPGQAKHPHIHPEMLLNTIEVVSGARATVAECGRDLAQAVGAVRQITDPLRAELVSAGSHPFAKPTYQLVTNKERYAELVKRTQFWGRQMLLFGTHVHVGIEDRSKVLPIVRALLTRFAHLQALASSSPFWAGQNTGYASNRAMTFQQLPTAGIPEQFDRWEELERYCADMLHTGVINGFDEIRWDIRPSPRLGTIELRVCDAATNLREVLALAALSHCLVEDFSTRLDRGEELPTMPPWFVAENKWRSARYGMDAILILDREGNEELITDTLERMLEELAPVAERLGCAEELADLRLISEFGASYQRQLAVMNANGGNLECVVDSLIAEMKADRPLDPAQFKPSSDVARFVTW